MPAKTGKKRVNGSITLRIGTWPALTTYCELKNTTISRYLQGLIDNDGKVKDVDIGSIKTTETKNVSLCEKENS